MKKLIKYFILIGCLFLFGCSRQTAETTIPEEVKIRVGSLKGPTSIGLVALMNNAAKGLTVNSYDDFTIAAAADELTTAFIKGELDIALVPANVAAVLYNKTQGGAVVIDINTLGVLYMVTGNTDITAMDDLVGRTIYLTGRGTSPDYVLQYLLDANDISTDDVILEYKAEAAEVAAVLSENPDAVGLLPQPFVTVACSQNDSLSIVLDMTEEWDKLQGENGGSLVTGVTIVRTEFLEHYPDAVEQFLSEHRESTEFTGTNPEETAEYVVELGIIAKTELAQKAIPYCNIVCMTGDDMKRSLSGYLTVLYEKDAASVGGALPEDDFYYIR